MIDIVFLKRLNDETNTLRHAYSLNEGKAFAMWYCIETLGLEEADAFQAVSLDGKNDKDIDLFWIDDETEKIIIGQFKYQAAGAYRGKKGELLSLIHSLDWLTDPEALKREGRPDLADAAHQYLAKSAEDYTVEFVYTFCGPSHKDVTDTARQFNVRNTKTSPGQSCKVYTLESLKNIYEEKIDQSTRIPKTTLKLNKYFEESGSYGKAVVATISGSELRRLYHDYGERLFDRNVRSYLGARKGGVNAGIQDTLKASTDRKNFWAYNNGITIVCDSFKVNRGSITAVNFSIVNGCQTTVSLSTTTEEAANEVNVISRFIAPPERIIDSIIRFNNSQNPIRLWDLNAQDKLQKRLKKELAELPQPFLYQLKRAERVDQKAKRKFMRDGKLQLIKHDRNAQYLAAFRGLPAVGYKDKGKVFTNYKDQVFPPQTRPEEIVLVWQAGKIASEYVKQAISDAAQKDDKMRLAILKRGGVFFVLAVAGIILHERNGSTFLNNLRPDVATSKTTVKRLTNYIKLSIEFYVDAVRDLVRQESEIPELVRSQSGWLKLSPKIDSRWRTYSLAKDIMENALPKI